MGNEILPPWGDGCSCYDMTTRNSTYDAGRNARDSGPAVKKDSSYNITMYRSSLEKADVPYPKDLYQNDQCLPEDGGLELIDAAVRDSLNIEDVPAADGEIGIDIFDEQECPKIYTSGEEDTFIYKKFDYLYERNYKIALDQFGDVVSTGFGGDGTFCMFWVDKEAQMQDQSFTNSYLGGDSCYLGAYGYPYNALAAAQNGNVYITGYSNWMPGEIPKTWIRSIDTTNSEVWFKDYFFADEMYFYGITVDGANNAYTVGTKNTLPLLKKFDPQGEDLWERLSNAGIGSFFDIAVNDNIYVMGIINKYTGQGSEIEDDISLQLQKYDQQGNLLLDKLFQYPGKDLPFAMSVDSLGNIYLTGEYLLNDNTYETNLWVRKYDPAGKELWVYTHQSSYSNDSFSEGSDIALDASGNIFVSGAAYSQDFSDMDALVIMLNPEGDFVWEDIFEGDNDQDNGWYSLAIDLEGAILATGFLDLPDEGSSIALKKYKLEAICPDD